MHKEPKDKSLDELKLLLEIRRLELVNQLQKVQYKLEIGTRFFRAIQKSGIPQEFEKFLQTSAKRKSVSPRKKSPPKKDSFSRKKS